MPSRVTREQAEKVLQALKDRWPEEQGWSHIDGPYLWPAEKEEQPEGCWSISWEGAPEDWVDYASMEIKVPGVFLEPMANWCLGLYPAWEVETWPWPE
jgi:hypothetical protein